VLLPGAAAAGVGVSEAEQPYCQIGGAAGGAALATSDGAAAGAGAGAGERR